MKNLLVNRCKKIDFKADVVGYCIDSDNGILYVLTTKVEVFKIEIYNQTNSEPERVEHNFEPMKSGIGFDDVLHVEFVVESGSIIVALKDGEIARIGVSSFSPPSECLFKSEVPLHSLKISPDQDLLAIADEADNVRTLSIDGILMNESNAALYNDSVHKPVGVGWGSKETQFFGLDGRPSKERQSKDMMVLSDKELDTIGKIEASQTFKQIRAKQNKGTVIDWRGDGQFIATLTYLRDSSKHILKVWNRNLELQYMSEQLVTVERGLLSWVPNGRYICCAQRRDKNVNEVAMFERNGMVHQRITLPLVMNDIYIKDIAWSLDSRILALIVHQFIVTNGQVSFKPILMLYTMQNFHYYLKFSTSLADDCDYLLRWDLINQNILHTISSKGQYTEFNCNLEVTFSREASTVASIDGNKLLLTPLESCAIPPPMSAIVIETNSPIYKIAMNSKSASNIFIITLDKKLIGFDTTCRDAPPAVIREANQLNLTVENEVAHWLNDNLEPYRIFQLDDGHSYQHLTVVKENCLAVVNVVENGSEVLLISVPAPEDISETTFKTLIALEGKQVLLVSRDDFGSEAGAQCLTLLLNDRSCVSVNLNTGETTTIFEFNPIVANSRNSFNFIDAQNLNATKVISLGQDLTLRFNADPIVSNSCTSFRITDHYLIYTTTNNHVHFILLHHFFHTGNFNCDIESWAQPIENGAYLVTADEKTSSVVLQMPRGNLEILHPRLLVFLSITDSLEHQDGYIEAMKLARINRINMNFLSDYLLCLDPSGRKINELAMAIAHESPTLLCTFISELQDGESVIDRYGNVLKHLPTYRTVAELERNLPEWRSGKAARVCANIDLPVENRFLHARLLCLLRQEQPSTVKRALEIVFSMPDGSRYEALKFIMYFRDGDTLFIDALRAYSTKIALMVANASNKDPKQYLVLLNEFDKIKDEHARKFKIDMHVKDYLSAFDNLLHVSKETEEKENIRQQLIELVVSKRIFKHALSKLINEEDQEALLEMVWSKYGEYLLVKRHYCEAGFAYSRAHYLSNNGEYFTSAVKSFSLVDEWERSVILIAKSKLDDSLKQEALTRVCKRLMETGGSCTSLVIAQTKVLPEETLNNLVSKNCWSLAYLFATEELRPKISESIVQSLDTCASLRNDELDSELCVAKKHFERLKKLLLTYKTRKLAQIDFDGNFASDTLSTVDGSELTSSSSGRENERRDARSGAPSIKTRISSKSGKSQAAKNRRINLKEGSKHEDIALIVELKKFLDFLVKSQSQVKKFTVAMFEHFALDEARGQVDELKKRLVESLTFSKEVRDLLWPSSPQCEQKYSLYKRFSDVLTTETFENVDFEVLIRPDLPNDVTCFEL